MRSAHTPPASPPNAAVSDRRPPALALDGASSAGLESTSSQEATLEQRALAWAEWLATRPLRRSGLEVEVRVGPTQRRPAPRPTQSSTGQLEPLFIVLERHERARHEIKVLGSTSGLAILIELAPTNVGASLEIPPEACVDLDSLRAQAESGAGGEPLMDVLGALPESFRLQVGTRACGALSSMERTTLRGWVARAAQRRQLLRMSWARTRCVSSTPTIEDELLNAVIALSGVYRRIAWSRDNDILGLAPRIRWAARRNERRPNLHSGAPKIRSSGQSAAGDFGEMMMVIGGGPTERKAMRGARSQTRDQPDATSAPRKAKRPGATRDSERQPMRGGSARGATRALKASSSTRTLTSGIGERGTLRARDDTALGGPLRASSPESSMLGAPPELAPRVRGSRGVPRDAEGKVRDPRARAEPAVAMRAGARIRISSGPFEGKSGRIEQVDEKGARVRLGQLSVRFARHQLELLDGGAQRASDRRRLSSSHRRST